MTGPTPKTSVMVVPDARTAAVEPLPGVAQLGINAAQVLQELGGELAAGHRDGAGRLDLLQEHGGLSCGDLLGDAARDQLAEHGVQPAGDLGAGAAQVPVALGPLPRYGGYADTGRGGAGGRG